MPYRGCALPQPLRKSDYSLYHDMIPRSAACTPGLLWQAHFAQAVPQPLLTTFLSLELGREHRHGRLSPQPFSMRKGEALVSYDGEQHKHHVPAQGLQCHAAPAVGGHSSWGAERRTSPSSLEPREARAPLSLFALPQRAPPALTSLALPLQFLPHTHTASSCYLCQQRETDTVH